MIRQLLWACAAVSILGCVHRMVPRSPFDEAVFQMKQGNPGRAVTLLTTLQAENPTNIEIATLITESYVKADRALEWDRRLTRSPPAGVPHALVQYMGGLVLFAQGAPQRTESIGRFSQAALEAPDQPEFVYRLGIALLETHQEKEAIVHFRKAIALSPNWTAYSLGLARALLSAGERAEAIQTLSHWLSLNPPAAQIAQAQEMVNRFDNPFTSLKFPEDARGELEKGLQWLNEADVPQEAMVNFESILARHPDLTVMHGLMGLCYQRLDDSGRAIDEFSQAISANPTQSLNHFYLAEVYNSHHRPDSASAEYTRALEFNPLLSQAYARLGEMALEARNLPRAEFLFSTLVILEPESIGYHGKLSLVRQLQQNFEGARQQLGVVLEIEPDNLEFQYRMGLLLFEMQTAEADKRKKKTERQESARWLRKVLLAKPDDALTLQALQNLEGAKQ